MHEARDAITYAHAFVGRSPTLNFAALRDTDIAISIAVYFIFIDYYTSLLPPRSRPLPPYSPLATLLLMLCAASHFRYDTSVIA
jgi:hypothetical protein